MTPVETAATARELNDRAVAAVDEAGTLRDQRDALVLELHAEHGWSYGQIATSVGVSRGLVAMICRPARR